MYVSIGSVIHNLCTFDRVQKRSPQTEDRCEWVPVTGCPRIFDIVWDCCADMMHIVSGICVTHLVPMMKGNKRPKLPPAPSKWHKDGTPWTKVEMDARKVKHAKTTKEWADLTRVRARATFHTSTQSLC